MRIGIVGLGFVGRAVQHYFLREHITPVVYDTGKHIGSLQEVSEADIIFLCLPTPFKNPEGYDDSALWGTMKYIEGKKIIVIKSTVLPGTTDEMQNTYPQHTILFNPEFLRAKTALKDFLHPQRQIIGYTKKSRPIAKRVLALLPKAPRQMVMRATEAEMVKYFCNAFLALRVVFANQMYDLCEALGINYERVKNAAGYDPRIGHSHFDIFHDGYRGYGGSCLPKDVKTLAQFAQKKGVKVELLKITDSINEKLIKKS